MLLKNKKINFKILYLLIPCLFGLYYDFTVYLTATIFMSMLIVKLIRDKGLKVYFNYCFLSILILTISSLFTCFWAVDKQDAVFGFFRILTILLFVILLMNQEKDSIIKSYKIIPSSGILMVLICIIIKFIPQLYSYFYSDNGRLGGFFQYSNTFALYLLIGINVLLHIEDKNKYKLLKIFILLIGILLTGSRTVFLLTILAFIIYLFVDKSIKEKLKISFLLIGTIIISLIIVYFTNSFETIGRYLTISLNSSTLWGRIIYYKDALTLIKNNIFGYGYMGYSYIYPTVQTANYATKFVHNDFLQLALDYGIVPMLIFLGTIIYSIFSKKTNKLQKIVLIIMFLHMLIDFDLQFLVMFFILIVMQDLSKQRENEIKIKKSIIVYICFIGILFGYVYLGIASFANYLDKNDLAQNMLSNYTEAKIKELSHEKDLIKINSISNDLLKNNKYIVVAYNAKALYELEKENYEKVCDYKEKAINLDKYNPEEYENYILLLSKILDKTIKNNDEENTQKYMGKVVQVLDIIEKNKKKTTKLSYKIQDSSNIELNEQTMKYIYEIKGVIENVKNGQKDY